jgi:glycosyltransferase involved in cell wall biosynthesis
VSVLLPVYNAEETVSHALESLLGQSFSDFEVVIIDDGSTDGSMEILRRCQDPRVRISSRENRGLAVSLNEALRSARGELVARHDADDTSDPNRFQRQVDYLDGHPSVGLVGTNYVLVDERGAEVVTADI